MTELRKEVARNERLVAQELYRRGQGADALAHLARALNYDPKCTLAAEAAVAMLNRWSFPVPYAVHAGDGHSNSGTIVFSPDGGLVLTACGTQASIWDPHTGRRVAVLSGHSEEINEASFCPASQLVVTASDDKTARIWDPRSGESLTTLRHKGEVDEAAFSPDGRSVLTVSDVFDDDCYESVLWDAQTGKMLLTLGHDDFVSSACFSPNGGQLVTRSKRSIRVWCASSGVLQRTLTGSDEGEPDDRDTICVSGFSPDGRLLVSTSRQGVRVWDFSTGELVGRLPHSEAVRDVWFSRDSQELVTLDAGYVMRVWE